VAHHRILNIGFTGVGDAAGAVTLAAEGEEGNRPVADEVPEKFSAASLPL
jgi:hypothetical protein